MDSNNIICVCKKSMTEPEFKTHYSKCVDFINNFKNFDIQLGELLKSYSEPKENLFIIKFLLKQYINVLEKKIKKHFPEKRDPIIFPEIKNDIQCCEICQSVDIIYLDCLHLICNKCFKEQAEKDMPNMKCPNCGQLISEVYKKTILGEKTYKELEKKFFENNLKDLRECPNCHEKCMFEPGKVDYNVKDQNNKKLGKKEAEDYANHRFRCPNCKKDSCVACKITPYHIGYTCETWKHHKEAKKCRYCDTEIKNNNKGPSDDVCNKSECKERYELSCKKILPCGHKCLGVKSETKCPPCLHSDCKNFVKLFDQDCDSYCNICFAEGLGSAPVVKLQCNHFVHYHCLKTRLEKKWNTPKITFNHCECPACKKWVKCPEVPALQKIIEDNLKLYKQICEMSLKRLKFEDLDKDKRLTDRNSPWYNKKLEFALKRLSYYMCHVCKKPYFAGRRECGDGPAVNNEDPNYKFNPEDLVCGKDANLSGVAGITECKKHGKEFIEYKCRFCCKIASWFCWGTTHFCEDCHKRQCSGDYVSKYPKEKLPKCNPSTCEVGGKHPANGEEYALGCSICRNSEENFKDF